MIPRIEQKLELTTSDYLHLLKWLKSKNAIILYPERLICSRYFDTTNLLMYSDTLEGIVPRKKVRVRTYNSKEFLDSRNPYNLEIKMTTEYNRLKTVKKNIDCKSLIENGFYDKHYGMCFEQVDISYNREYFLVAGFRVTIDKDIKYKLTGINQTKINTEFLDRSLVLEIKADIKTSLTLLLNEFDFPRSRFSKYERALEALIS